VTVSGPLRVDTYELLFAATADDGGLALLPVRLAHNPTMKTLTRVLPDYVVPGEPLQLVNPASRHTPQRVRLLCEHIVVASSGCPNDKGQAASDQCRCVNEPPDVWRPRPMGPSDW